MPRKSNLTRASNLRHYGVTLARDTASARSFASTCAISKTTTCITGDAVAKPDLQPHAYVLAVRDLAGSSAYFVDVLGFTREWEGDDWHCVARGQVRVMLGRCPNAIPPSELGDHSYFGYFETDDVNGLHDEFAARGARIRATPSDKPWGWREMHVETPEGHRI